MTVFAISAIAAFAMFYVMMRVFGRRLAKRIEFKGNYQGIEMKTSKVEKIANAFGKAATAIDMIAVANIAMVILAGKVLLGNSIWTLFGFTWGGKYLITFVVISVTLSFVLRIAASKLSKLTP